MKNTIIVVASAAALMATSAIAADVTLPVKARLLRPRRPFPVGPAFMWAPMPG
jgi:hypothetical protein